MPRSSFEDDYEPDARDQTQFRYDRDAYWERHDARDAIPTRRPETETGRPDLSSRPCAGCRQVDRCPLCQCCRTCSPCHCDDP